MDLHLAHTMTIGDLATAGAFITGGIVFIARVGGLFIRIKALEDAIRRLDEGQIYIIKAFGLHRPDDE